MARSTDAEGRFFFKSLSAGSYTLKAEYLGYADQSMEITQPIESELLFILQVEPIQAETFTVSAYRAAEDTPMAFQNIDAEELQKRNLGVDVPALLDISPSLFFTSDAGTGIGYTYLRIRGSDQSNVNVMINGVPLNDAESQGVFWVDLPDLASSTENIQIQRGVGTSVNGAGGFGGSINLQTKSLDADAYGRVALSGGSFNTQRISVQAGTGLLNEHWSLDARISEISSDGYIDRSGASLTSYYLSTGYVDAKNTIKVIGFGGHEVTHQAWFGVPRARLENDVEGMLGFAADNGFSDENTQLLLNADRKYNYYSYDDEVDDYQQQHYQLHYGRQWNKEVRSSVALHYTRGLGFFEQFQDASNNFDDTSYSFYGLQDPEIGNDTLSSSDFIRRRWLDNHFYGMTANLSWVKGKWNSVLGMAANRYEGGHYGEVISVDFMPDLKVDPRYYDNDALKSEFSTYLRSSYELSQGLTAYLDLQQRLIDYSFLGLLNDGSPANQQVNFSFFNPKAGISYADPKGHRAFISFARAHKEPNRDDMVISTLASRPRAQRLDDLEMGYSYHAKKFALDLVLYAMEYKDQLINTGEINDVGEAIRSNVQSSYRRGLEIVFNYRPMDRLCWKANMTLSQNIIKDHMELVRSFDAEYNSSMELETFGDSPISYSPDILAFSEWTYTIVRNKNKSLDLSLATKYVGEQQLDNTGNNNKVIDAFLVNDLSVFWTLNPGRLKALKITLQVRNMFNEQYASNGWTYRYNYAGSEVSYDALFPQAGRNFLAGISIDL